MEEKYYVVFKGRKCGIFFDTWDNVKQLTEGFSGNHRKTFKNETLAREAYGKFRGEKAKVRTVKEKYKG
jgi:viroplasmin and RNaseH domain-containing protein